MHTQEVEKDYQSIVSQREAVLEKLRVLINRLQVRSMHSILNTSKSSCSTPPNWCAALVGTAALFAFVHVT